MSGDRFRLSLHSMLVVLMLAATAVGQTAEKSFVDPVGEIITNGNQVTINGRPARRGSTVFNGSEISTREAAAFLTFPAGGGVLSIAPGSQVKVSRERAKIIAKVIKGSVTLRSRLASTVIAPDRVITSKPDNLYTVSISDSGTVVESLMDSVAVQMANGAVETIMAKAVAAMTPTSEKPEPNEREGVSPVGGSFITERCVLNGTTLMVSGVVACRGLPVKGTVVTLRVRVGFMTIRRETTTDGKGRYKFTLTNNAFRAGGTASVNTEIRRRGCKRGENICTF